jgi:serine/threonine protein kinase
VFLADDRLGPRARANDTTPGSGLVLAKKYLLGRKISDNPESDIFEATAVPFGIVAAADAVTGETSVSAESVGESPSASSSKYSVKIFRSAPVAQMLDVLQLCELVGTSAPRLVLPVDVFFTANRWVLVEPLAETNAWRFFAATPAKDATELRSLLWAVVGALSALHDVGVVHGNVRPETILTIGNVWALASCQYPYACNYRAPEILLNPDAVSPGADFFALGVSIVELVRGKRWAAAKAPVEDLLEMALTADVTKLLAGVETDIVEAVEALTSLDPRKRLPEKTVKLADGPVQGAPRKRVRQPTKFVAAQPEDNQEDN